MPSIDPNTTVGVVRLVVNDLERSTRFYEQLLGMQPQPLGASSVAFASADGEVLIELSGSPHAAPRNPRQTGLFHFAVLYPTRRDLAAALMRLASASWPLSGASDHIVSEAIYLNDPDGNGIEIYADRPREAWRFSSDGQVAMDTLPLDLDDLVAELAAAPLELDGGDRLLPAGTRMGHVHLQVASIPEAEDFYAGLLGFDVMARMHNSALFVSAGGYHHHLGMNTWNSRGAAAPQPGSVGLSSFDVVLPTPQALQTVTQRVASAGLPMQESASGWSLADPSGNTLVLRSA